MKTELSKGDNYTLLLARDHHQISIIAFLCSRTVSAIHCALWLIMLTLVCQVRSDITRQRQRFAMSNRPNNARVTATFLRGREISRRLQLRELLFPSPIQEINCFPTPTIHPRIGPSYPNLNPTSYMQPLLPLSLVFPTWTRLGTSIHSLSIPSVPQIPHPTNPFTKIFTRIGTAQKEPPCIPPQSKPTP